MPSTRADLKQIISAIQGITLGSCTSTGVTEVQSGLSETNRIMLTATFDDNNSTGDLVTGAHTLYGLIVKRVAGGGAGLLFASGVTNVIHMGAIANGEISVFFDPRGISAATSFHRQAANGALDMTIFYTQ